jgi:glutathione S-transferase
MAELTLYHAAPSRSSIAHWMLEEIGQPYGLHLLSLKNGDNRKPDYLAVNRRQPGNSALSNGTRPTAAETGHCRV